MKKSLGEYATEIEIPIGYDLSLKEIYDIREQARTKGTIALLGLYNWAFERGRKCERKHQKK